MVLYRPGGFKEITLDEPYKIRGWTDSYGCNRDPYRYRAPPGWKCDPSYPEVTGPVGSHGGCSYCVMTELQVIANYQTEVTFISNPPGAQIFIDGVEWWPGAVTAADGATFRGIPPGTHTYELRKSGYISATGTFDLALNTPVTISNTLYSTSCVPNWQCEPGQTGYEVDGCGNRRENPLCLPLGSIKLTTSIPGAEIFLDGTDQGIRTPSTITSIPAGSHNYALKLAGFNDATGTVQVIENQTAEVSVQLIPGEGCIYFNTSVPGAKIYVDNVDTGKVTPSLVCGLTLGAHTYRLSLTGYQDNTGSFNLAAGQGTTVTVPLTKKSAGTGTLIALGLIGAGVLGAVILSGKETK